MIDRKRSKSEIGELGEALVVPHFLDLLGWTARKDVPDEGFDHSVEISATDGKPARRFLIQVKTSERQKLDRQRRWKLPVRSNALKHYRQSRHPVFLIGVCLATRSIRWLDLLEELRGNDRNGPFLVPDDQVFDEAGAASFRSAIDAAFEATDLDHVRPARLLDLKAARMRATDPNLHVKIDIVGGKEVISYVLLDGRPLKFSVRPATKKDAEQMARSYEFGSTEEFQVEQVKISGLSALADLAGGGRLKIVPAEKSIRLRLRSTAKRSKASIEVDAKVTNGKKGITFRSDDTQSLFAFTIVVDVVDNAATILPVFSPEPWRGHPVTALPMFEKIHALTCALRRGESFALDGFSWGEFHQLFTLKTIKCSGLEDIAGYIDFLRRLAKVCRYFNAPAIPWRNQAVSPDQQENIELAYQLCRKGAIQHMPTSIRVTARNQADSALHRVHAGSTGSVEFSGTLPVSFGDDAIAEIPVKQSVDSMVLIVTESDECLMQPALGAKGTMSLLGWKASDAVWPGLGDDTD